MDSRLVLAIASTNHYYLSDFLLGVRHLPISLRTIILAICRVQVPPNEHPTLLARLKPFLHHQIPIVRNAREEFPTFKQLIYPVLKKVSHNPVVMGFVSMILRNEPYSDTSGIGQVIEEQIIKELEATHRADRPNHIDWYALMREPWKHPPPCFGYGVVPSMELRVKWFVGMKNWRLLNNPFRKYLLTDWRQGRNGRTSPSSSEFDKECIEGDCTKISRRNRKSAARWYVDSIDSGAPALVSPYWSEGSWTNGNEKGVEVQ